MSLSPPPVERTPTSPLQGGAQSAAPSTVQGPAPKATSAPRAHKFPLPTPSSFGTASGDSPHSGGRPWAEAFTHVSPGGLEPRGDGQCVPVPTVPVWLLGEACHACPRPESTPGGRESASCPCAPGARHRPNEALPSSAGASALSLPPAPCERQLQAGPCWWHGAHQTGHGHSPQMSQPDRRTDET